MKKNYSAIPLLDTANMTEETWLAARDHGDGSVKWAIGGSDTATVLGISPWKTPLDLYYKKKNVAYAVKQPENKEAFAIGHKYEEDVALDFCRIKQEEGYEVELIKDTFLYQHGEYVTNADGSSTLKYPFALANLDYMVKLTKDGVTEFAILECKTTSCNNYKIIEGWKKGIPPKYYVSQCSYYMSIMNIDKTYLVCKWGLSYKDVAVIEIERDLDYEEYLMESVANFVNCLETDTEPTMVSYKPENAIKFYRNFYGAVNEKETFEFPAECKDLIERYISIQTEITSIAKALEEKENAKLEIVAALAPYYKTFGKGKFQLTDDTIAELKYSVPRVFKADEELIKAEIPDKYNKYQSFLPKNLTVDMLPREAIASDELSKCIKFDSAKVNKTVQKWLKANYPDAYDKCIGFDASAFKNAEEDFDRYRADRASVLNSNLTLNVTVKKNDNE